MWSGGSKMLSPGQIPRSRGATVWWDPGEGKWCQRRRGRTSGRSYKIWGRIIRPWYLLRKTILRWPWVWLGPSVFLLFLLLSQGTPLLQLRVYTSPVWGTSPILGSIEEPSKFSLHVFPNLRSGSAGRPCKLPTSPPQYNLQRNHP